MGEGAICFNGAVVDAPMASEGSSLVAASIIANLRENCQSRAKNRVWTGQNLPVAVAASPLPVPGEGQGEATQTGIKLSSLSVSRVVRDPALKSI